MQHRADEVTHACLAHQKCACYRAKYLRRRQREYVYLKRYCGISVLMKSVVHRVSMCVYVLYRVYI